jgi:hypothetical protein
MGGSFAAGFSALLGSLLSAAVPACACYHPIRYSIFDFKPSDNGKVLGVYGAELAVWVTIRASFLRAQRVLASEIGPSQASSLDRANLIPDNLPSNEAHQPTIATLMTD